MLHNAQALAQVIAGAFLGCRPAVNRVQNALMDWLVVTNPTHGWDQAEAR